MLRKIGVALAIVVLGVCFVLTGQVPGMEFNTSASWQYIMLLSAIGMGIFSIADILSVKTTYSWTNMVKHLFDRVISIFAVLFLAWLAFFVAQAVHSLATFTAVCLGALALWFFWYMFKYETGTIRFPKAT